MSSEKGWRGGEQQLAYLLDHLRCRSIHNVLAVKRGSALEDYSRKNGIPCYAMKYSNSLDILSAWKIHRICKDEGIDVMHLHSSKAHGVAVLSTLYGNKVPMVLSRRVAFYPGKNLFSSWKYNHRQIRRIICVSDKIRLIMQEVVKDSSRCVTVYSGIDLNKFDDLQADRDLLVREFRLDPGKKFIIGIGAIDASKDHFTFVRTIARLVEAGHSVQGLVVGDGPLAHSVRRYAVEEKVADHIRFAGWRSDVGQLLIAADVFLMTSREEGLGTSILDSFLARVPVVATATGGIPEIVRNEETGLIAPVGDAEKLSGQIVRLLSDNPLRDRLIRNASAFVTRFSKEDTSARTYNIYQEVLNS